MSSTTAILDKLAQTITSMALWEEMEFFQIINHEIVTVPIAIMTMQLSEHGHDVDGCELDITVYTGNLELFHLNLYVLLKC